MSKESRFTGPFDRQKVNGIKECWNMNDTTFTMFIDHCEPNEVRKSLSYW